MTGVNNDCCTESPTAEISARRPCVRNRSEVKKVRNYQRYDARCYRYDERFSHVRYESH